jgi:hypothetical protein
VLFIQFASPDRPVKTVSEIHGGGATYVYLHTQNHLAPSSVSSTSKPSSSILSLIRSEVS